MKFLLSFGLLLSTVYQTVQYIVPSEEASELASTSIYDFAIKDIDNNPVSLADFKGKKILFVNVASKCGYTSQYAELQKLHEKYKEKLVVIGLPCNQFGGQEPGTGEEIKTFCQKNYGVEFLITEKIDVKGDNQHAIYKWLTSKTMNGKMDSEVKWNFTKYLVSETGTLIEYFSSNVEPMSELITKQLK
ncbi:MAG: glutathione peroxidase [Crocinitomicaceae bacterium]